MDILYRYLRPYWKLIFVALTLAAVNQIFSLLDPYIYRLVIDRYASHFKDFGEREYIYGILKFVGLAVGAAMVSRIAKNFQDYFISVITQRVGTQIYTDGIKHSLALPYQVFEDQRSGQTLGVLQKVKTDTERMITSVVNVVFQSLIGITFVIIYAWSIYWPIAPVYFLTIPIIAWLSSVLSKRIKKIQTKIVSETTALAGSTTESLRNIELVKSLGLTDQEIKRLNGNTEKILGLELRKVKFVRTLGFVQGTTINFMRSCIVALMLWLIFKEVLSIGEYFSLLLYSFFIFGPLQELGNVIQLYREAEVSLNNFRDIMSRPKEAKPAQPIKLSKIEKVDFKDVSFKHLTASRPALREVDFEVKKGETIAFAGPSGSGKTTLIKLLVGLYDPEQGSIAYNGIDSRQIDKDELREQIGFVAQDAQLFSGTIRENLLFVKPTATDEECLDVLQKSAAYSLLNRADNGLDTVIGEGGMKVSGGEKQRLSIARALLRKPNLLIFDEATSALDSLTEEEITQTIREISNNQQHITVLIAHRLSTIMHADRIFVFEKGKIIESGNHEDLLTQKGLYYAMWRQQVGESEVVTNA
ncbi:ABC transporter ATP-binding protein [Runella sp.]|uniref:ABC transporter ATP-binding protein n=1 Tax=Runella sp. TaxID=1960881 RepID=UPI003D0BAB0A